ncbi:rhombosortase [Cellvibrio polysaccharolyticus]|uniref:Rhombosortase n=1 Tax=Cellvibrio polysaccharolyticus TaxID=2082724 RepID=A0A928V672_9GAMM|nr:rhombosortase [Cellvibrio polysaccharolyticus]MBE8716824.1 rhombosortase [Cellvibrio polysaccharolyticus]
MPAFTLNRMDILTLLLVALLALAGLFQTITEPLLQFDRNAIAQGEWWRLISSQFIHYGVYHLLMNAAALVIINAALWRDAAVKHYLATLITCLAVTGIGLWFFDPELFFYAGLSGTLHGLIIAGLLLTLPQTPTINALALLVIWGKVIYEHTPWFDPQHALLPVPVAVDAHLWGAVAGTFAGLILLWIQRQVR